MAVTLPQVLVGFGVALVALGCSPSMQGNTLPQTPMDPALNAPAASVVNITALTGIVPPSGHGVVVAVGAD